MFLAILLLVAALLVLAFLAYILSAYDFSWVHGVSGAAFLVLGILGIWMLYQSAKADTTQVVVTPTPTPAVATSTPPPAVPTSTPIPAAAPTQTSEPASAPTAICRNSGKREYGGSNSITVEPGHLLNLEWYGTGWLDHVRSILPEGTYTLKEGFKFGGGWDYEDCTYEQVLNQSGSDTDWTEGMTKS